MTNYTAARCLWAGAGRRQWRVHENLDPYFFVWAMPRLILPEEQGLRCTFSEASWQNVSGYKWRGSVRWCSGDSHDMLYCTTYNTGNVFSMSFANKRIACWHPKRLRRSVVISFIRSAAGLAELYIKLYLPCSNVFSPELCELKDKSNVPQVWSYDGRDGGNYDNSDFQIDKR